jgi:hypothetical protein
VVKQSAPASSGAKSATRRSSNKATGTRKITPEQALENTRRLLEAKHEHDRQPQPWQQLDDGHAPAPQAGHESVEVAAKAEELHAAESRLQGNHGSSSTQDRHNQGKRDNR